MKEFPIMKMVIFDDTNDKTLYKALTEEYNKKLQNYSQYIEKIQKVINLPEMPQEIKNYYDLPLYKFEIVALFNSYEDLEKNFDIINKDEKYLFIIDFKYKNSQKSGIDIAERLIDTFRTSKYVLLTAETYNNFSFVKILYDSGFNGLIYKSESMESWQWGVLLSKIVASQGFYLDINETEQLLANTEYKLSYKEQKFLNLFVLGKTHIEIAQENPYQEELFNRIKDWEKVKANSKEYALEYNKSRNLFNQYKNNIIEKLDIQTKDSENRDELIKKIIKKASEFLMHNTLKQIVKKYLNEQ